MSAQSLDVWVDAAAAHARPPAGVPDVDPSMLGWIGGRLRVDRLGPLALDLSGRGGRSAESAGGTWLDGAIGVQAARWLGALNASGRIELFGLDYRRPFSYHAYGFKAAPRLAHTIGSFIVSAHGEFTRGGWRLAGPLDTGPGNSINSSADGPIALTGGGLVVGRAVGPAWLEASAEAYDATNGDADGTFAALGVSAAFSAGAADVSLGGAYWSTPRGTELGLGATISARLGERSVAFATVEKSATDPLFGTPGSVTASIGMSVRLAERRIGGTAPVAEITEPAGRGRKVRFQLPGRTADRVALAGTFTDWEPRPMKRAGEQWILELVLEPGVHHFVFLLDGDRWYVPDNAPGIVDDGWGRRNASLVIVEGP
ncbi:MAG TPA: glycogen-binding domain-containing protein [Longimicrobiales bacterium]